MSIFSAIFGPATPAAPAPAVAAPTPGNIPAAAAVASQSATTVATAPNGVVPANAVVTEGAAKSGLDAFADIWNTQATEGAQGQPLFNVSQEKMMESARKQDFKSTATPEQMAAIQAGGAEAANAMFEIMNEMTQKVYAQSAFATTRLIEGALDKSQFAKATDIDSRIRSSTLSNNLRAENPIFNHPAALPLLKSVQETMLVKFPNATPAELTKMAQDYLMDFAAMAKGPEVAAAAAKAPKGEDWSKW